MRISWNKYLNEQTRIDVRGLIVLANGGKIKNWSRSNAVSAPNVEMVWNHDKKHSRSDAHSVVVRNNPDGGYDVSLPNKPGIRNRHFDTKEGAREFAVRWMRAHPRG